MRLQLRVLKRGKTSKAGVAVFLMVRDEAYLLPFFFSHYRSIGIEEFWVYADRCLPPTMEILTAQSDVTILTGDYEYGQSFGTKANGYPRRLGAVLKESMDDLLPDRWVFVVDADEFAFLPPPARDICQLVNVLERANQPYTTAPMVDLYPQCLVLRNYQTTISPFEMSIFFDEGPYYAWQPGKLAPKVFHGGVRHRLHRLLSQQFPSEIKAINETCGIAPFSNWKVPLVKHGAGIRRNGAHLINISPTPANAVALAHFKFHPGLEQKIAIAVGEMQYFGGSVEYRVLELAISKLPFETLVYAGSRQFTGAESLVGANLLSPLNGSSNHET